MIAAPIFPTAIVQASSTGETAALGHTEADTAGIPIVGGAVQARPMSEDQAQAWSDAFVFAEEHPNDVGYPFIDPQSGVLLLSSASDDAGKLLSGAASEAPAPTKVRNVSFSFSQLEEIKQRITLLREEGIPDADLIYMAVPDHERSRIIITVREGSTRLFQELAQRFGTEAIAVRISDDEWGASPGSRQSDVSPYYGGSAIVTTLPTPNRACSDAFSWVIGGPNGNAMLTAAHCAPSGGPVQIASASMGAIASGSEENWDDLNGTQYYTGQSVYRGDVALIRLNSNRESDPYIYRGGANSSTSSRVVHFFNRYSTSGDTFYVGGSRTGESGPYTVDLVGVDVIYNPPSNRWVRNASSALLISSTCNPCTDQGDSGGSVFALDTGGVKAAGVYSGQGPGPRRIYFTDIYRSYLGLPGAPLLY